LMSTLESHFKGQKSMSGHFHRHPAKALKRAQSWKDEQLSAG
jgi:hypothetical protein